MQGRGNHKMKLEETNKYKLSLYVEKKLIQKDDTCSIFLTQSSLDGKLYIKRVYHEDKRDIFRALQAVTSNYIPQIYEVIFLNDLFVIEEYVPGRLLSDIQKEKHSSKEYIQMAWCIAKAMQALQEKKIVHRDIKTQNIIACTDGTYKLIDYGIARLYDSEKQRDTEQFGTRGYAAPEQYGFSQSDAKTDCYSYGQMLKEMEENWNVPYFMKKIIKRCTKFDPTERYENASAILKALQRGRNSGKILAAIGFGLILETCVLAFFRILGKTNKESIVYDRLDERIIKVETAEACMPMWGENGTFEGKISLAGDGTYTKIKVQKIGKKLQITISDNNIKSDSFVLENQYDNLSPSYPDTIPEAEILFYDIDNDGILDILPAVANRKRVTGMIDGQNMENLNDTSVWLIQKKEDTYTLNPVQMYDEESRFELEEIDGRACLWLDADFNYYMLDDNGKLVRKQM